MKKRLVCLLLSAIMIMACFVGCAEKTGDEVKIQIGEEASKDAVTLSMYLMSEKPVKKTQVALMEQKVNEITEEQNINIHIELTYLTPSEYYKTLEKNIAKMKEFYSSQDGINKETEKPEYIDKVTGLPKVHYPSLEDFEVDIFYFGGQDKYIEYKSNGYLANLTTQFKEGVAKPLKNEINSEILNSLMAVEATSIKKDDGDIYAVPTNRQIGEYSYMLLNKDVLRKTQQGANEVGSLISSEAQYILNMVDEYMRDEYVPLYSSTGELALDNVKYFGGNANGLLTDREFSVLGGTVGADWTYGTTGKFPQMTNILNSESDQIKTLVSYKEKGYYATEEESDKPFAIGYIKGTATDVERYKKDYEIITLANPTIYTEDVFEHMFGVTSCTNSLDASMKIITLLNTDENFRNLILYGVEGENYTFVDVTDDLGNSYRVVERQTKDADKLYVMAAEKTGNVALAYPAVDEDPAARSKINIQNHNAGLKRDVVFGFNFYTDLAAKKSTIDSDIHDIYKTVSKYSSSIYKRLNKATTVAEVEAIISEVNAKFNDQFNEVIEKTNSKAHAGYYQAWLIKKQIYNPQG